MVVAPSRTAASTTSSRNTGSVRVASWAENSTSSVKDFARRTLSRTASTTCRSLIRSISRMWISLVTTKPRHHLTESLPDFLDPLLAAGGAQGLELRIARAGLEDPLLRELTGADLRQDPAHLLLRALVHHPGSARVVAVLGGVGHAV